MFDKVYLIKSISAVTNYNSSSCLIKNSFKYVQKLCRYYLNFYIKVGKAMKLRKYKHQMFKNKWLKILSMSIFSVSLLFKLRYCESAGSRVVTKCAPNSLSWRKVLKMSTPFFHFLFVLEAFMMEPISISPRSSSWETAKALVHVRDSQAQSHVVSKKVLQVLAHKILPDINSTFHLVFSLFFFLDFLTVSRGTAVRYRGSSHNFRLFPIFAN